MIRIHLPHHLRALANVQDEVKLEVEGTPTLLEVLVSLETRYPMLAGTILDHGTRKRRPFLRFFAGREDLSHLPMETPLPPPVVSGAEPFLIIGAISGG